MATRVSREFTLVSLFFSNKKANKQCSATKINGIRDF